MNADDVDQPVAIGQGQRVDIRNRVIGLPLVVGEAGVFGVVEGRVSGKRKKARNEAGFQEGL